MNKGLREHLENYPAPTAQKPRRHHTTNLAAARILSILLCVQGLACILFTDRIYSFFPYILGGIMILIGLLALSRGVITEEYKRIETKLTSNGIVMLLFGVVILLRHRNADTLIGSVWGVIGLFKGSEELNTAIYHWLAKEPFTGEAVHAVVELLLAIALLLDPIFAVKNHLFILGLELIWHSINLFRESKKRKC